MFKRNCVVKLVDSFGVKHAANVEAESLFEAAIRAFAAVRYGSAALHSNPHTL